MSKLVCPELFLLGLGYSLGNKYTRATPPIRLSVVDTPRFGKWFVGICSRAGDG
jgi:hypothetical protein